MDDFIFPSNNAIENIGDYVQFGIEDPVLTNLGGDLYSQNIEEFMNNIPMESVSNTDMDVHDPLKNTITDIPSFWHLKQVKEIKLGEILLLGFQYSQTSLSPHLLRLDAEFLPHTTIICKNPNIHTIKTPEQLEALSHVGLNTFLYLEIGRTIHISKLLQELQVSNLNQNVFAKLKWRNKIGNTDRSLVKTFIQQFSSKYSMIDLANITRQVLLEIHGRESIFEPEHICLSCKRIVKQGHTDITCRMGKITETSKCHFTPFSSGLLYPCLRKFNTNHDRIHTNIITHKSFYLKLPSTDLNLNVDSSLQWQNISEKLDYTRSINVVSIPIMYEERDRMYFVQKLLPQKLVSNQLMLAINCKCENLCNSHQKNGQTKIPCKDIKCNCIFFLLNNFLCLIWPSGTVPATLLTAPVVSAMINEKLSVTPNLAQKNTLVLYIFSNKSRKMCFGKTFNFLYQLSAKVPKIRIYIIYVSSSESNIREISDKYDFPVLSC